MAKRKKGRAAASAAPEDTAASEGARGKAASDTSAVSVTDENGPGVRFGRALAKRALHEEQPMTLGVLHRLVAEGLIQIGPVADVDEKE